MAIFTKNQVITITEVPGRRIQLFRDKGIIHPKMIPGDDKRGNVYFYSYTDLVHSAIANKLVDQGIRTSFVKKIIEEYECRAELRRKRFPYTMLIYTGEIEILMDLQDLLLLIQKRIRNYYSYVTDGLY